MSYCDMYVNLLRCFPGSITLQMPQMKLGFTIDPQQHWWPNNQQQKNVLRREGRLLTEAKAWNLGRKLGKKNELSQKAEISQNHNVQCVAIAVWHVEYTVS